MKPRLLESKLPLALARVEAVLQEGERRYPDDKWRRQPVRLHLWRTLRHLLLWLVGNQSEDHLGHAVTRFLMALELTIERYLVIP